MSGYTALRKEILETVQTPLLYPRFFKPITGFQVFKMRQREGHFPTFILV